MLKKLLGFVCTAAVAFVLVGTMSGCGDEKKKTTTTDTTTTKEPPPTQKR